MKHLKTQQELNEASENLNISDASDSKINTPCYTHNGLLRYNLDLEH